MKSDLHLKNDDLIQNLLNDKAGASTDFLLFSPLYKTFQVHEDYTKSFEEYLSKDIRFGSPVESPLMFDAYCPKCKKDSTFKDYFTEHEATTTNFKVEYDQGYRRAYDLNPFVEDQRVYVKEYTCMRDNSHVNVYVFLLSKKYDSNLFVTKIGEHPSPLVNHTLDLKKYKKHFKQYHDELVKSLRVYSMGIGVGAFVYLRRIFESLVWTAYERHKETNTQLDDNKFKNKGMADKIDFLRVELPEFLVENKILYSILSKGIHSLDESTCLQIFNFIKDSILLILDQEVERIEKENKINKLKKDISNLNSTLGSI